VKLKRWMPWATMALAAGALLTATGASARVDVQAKPAAPAAKAAAVTAKLGLVTDIGGLNDRSFNALANKGRLDAARRLKIQTRVLISKSNADYVPNLATLARQGYTPIIGVGFLMSDAIDTVARRFPNTQFAIVDFSNAALKNKPKNVLGLIFKEQEAGCLVGTAAALISQSKILSSVGGIKIPPVDRFIAGYQFCAKRAVRGTRTLNGYSQDFVAQDKCKEVALNHINAGADVVFQVAGQCGLGALDAAKENSVWGIGVDANQGHLGRHILTSAQKKVDVAVYTAANLVKTNRFKGGGDITFDVRNGGIDYGTPLRASAAIKNRVNAVKAQIKAGKFPRIPTTVK
jgi:basic membrane protein A and related proteins